MEHDFTPVIRDILTKYFGDVAEDLFEKSPLLQYINLKTVSATRGSKARSSFANLYAIFVLVEDYLTQAFRKFFPQVDAQPILRVVETKRYWINIKLIMPTLGRKTFNLARPLVEIIEAYAAMKQASFESFIHCHPIADERKSWNGAMKSSTRRG